MIHDPLFLILVLLAVESGVLWLAANPPTKRLFSFLPSMFWIYFLPMLLSTCGIIDPQSPVYAKIPKYFLAPALFLLLLDIDIQAIFRLGPVALVMFFAGSLGIMLGMVAAFLTFKPLVGGQFWGGFAALSASWTGGSANMVAVKEALNVPDAVFLPMVIVDTILPYTWIGILTALAGRQQAFDRWNRSDRRILDDLARRARALSQTGKKVVPAAAVVAVIALAFLAGRLCQSVSLHLPTGNNILTPYAWSILLVTALAMALSMTPVSRMAGAQGHQWGKWILYFVLTSIGARASLSHASQVGILIAAGIMVLSVHVLVLLVTARLVRAPLFLMATASLSNLAGLVSAPMIAELYQPGLACVGLLLAILGHCLGAYFGLLTGQICRLAAGY